MQFTLIIATTVLAYFVLYTPQPLLPLFARTFSLSESESALVIAATLLPLGIAPLSYGYLLESVSSVRLLRASVLALSISTLAFGLADSFPLLVGLRLVQGLLLPAVFTSILAYIAAPLRGVQLQRVMSLYITSGIVGGYLGRVLAGLTATYTDWRVFFLVLSVALFGCAFLLRNLDERVRIRTEKPGLAIILSGLRDRTRRRVYWSVLCLFFVFVALLNFIPFRLGEIRENPSEMLTGFMYSGYVLGVVSSLAARRLVSLFRGQANTIVGGFCLYLAMLVLALLPQVWILFSALFIFCATMFLVHTVALTVVNEGSHQNTGMINGLYLSFYYSGGVLGAYFTGVVYERFGWAAFIVLLLAVATAGLVLALANRSQLNTLARTDHPLDAGQSGR